MIVVLLCSARNATSSPEATGWMAVDGPVDGLPSGADELVDDADAGLVAAGPAVAAADATGPSTLDPALEEAHPAQATTNASTAATRTAVLGVRRPAAISLDATAQPTSRSRVTPRRLDALDPRQATAQGEPERQEAEHDERRAHRGQHRVVAHLLGRDAALHRL